MTHDEQLAGSFPDPASSLTISHLWLAYAVARRFQGRGQDLDDLRQIARRPAYSRPPADTTRAMEAFAPFAASTVSGVIKRHFRDHAWTVRPPRRTQQLALEISRHWSDAAQECQHQPTDTSLAAAMGEPVDDIREARSASGGYNAVSIDADMFPAAASAALDPGYDRCEAQILVAQAWRLLEPAERDSSARGSGRTAPKPSSRRGSGSVRCRSRGSSPETFLKNPPSTGHRRYSSDSLSQAVIGGGAAPKGGGRGATIAIVGPAGLPTRRAC